MTTSEKIPENLVKKIRAAQNQVLIDMLPVNRDVFYVSKYPDGTVASFAWVYYNPDSTEGGQLVYNEFSPKLVLEACRSFSNTDDILSYIGELCNQTLCDITSSCFAEEYSEFASAKTNEEDCIYAVLSSDNDAADKLSISKAVLKLISFSL